jgi:hypothetical protein
MKIPVISTNGNPLMPTTPSRARKLIQNGFAIPFFKLGIFCIRITKESENNTQSVALGVDPGSKKEGYTVKSDKYTFINIQSDALSWVKDKMEERSNMRRGRRFRNTPCRKPRWSNRGNSMRPNRIPPSTKARYDLKISIINKLSSIYPINNENSGIIYEDIKAITKKGQKRWNKSFSPLEVGKKYFKQSLIKLGFKVKLNPGYSTSKARKFLGLSKTKDKLSNQFSAHCVDSWVMANECVGGHSKPDNDDVLYISPINFGRRKLYVFQYAKGGSRKRCGGTRSLGFKKGKEKSGIINGKYYLVGGFSNEKLTLCSLSNHKKDNRLNRTINPKDCKFISYNRFTINMSP